MRSVKKRSGVARAGDPRNTLTPVTGAMANEFSDIFCAIVGFSELAAIRQLVREDPKLAAYIDEIHKGGLRGSQLLRLWVEQTGIGEKETEGSALPGQRGL